MEDAKTEQECDYCTKEATIECEDCQDLFVCDDHEESFRNGGLYCDQCVDKHEEE